MCVGVVPFVQEGPRRLNRMLLPSALLSAMAYRSVYGATMFHLPGFVSERVTTRFLIVPVLWLMFAGVVRMNDWWRKAKESWTIGFGVVVASAFLLLQVLLRAHSWRPHAGDAAAVLPTGITKQIPVENGYWWAFWTGLVITAIAIGGITLASLRPWKLKLKTELPTAN